MIDPSTVLKGKPASLDCYVFVQSANVRIGAVLGTNITRPNQVQHQGVTPMVSGQVQTTHSTQQATRNPGISSHGPHHLVLTRCISLLRHRPAPSTTRQQSRRCGHFLSETPVHPHHPALTTPICGHFLHAVRRRAPAHPMAHGHLQPCIRLPMTATVTL